MTKIEKKQRIIIGISGASGIQYGIRLLELMRPLPIETHLIISKAAQQVRQYEVDMSLLTGEKAPWAVMV